MTYLKKTILITLLLSVSACNEYWWTRGQPPSTKELLTRASKRVEESSISSRENRTEISDIANIILESSNFLLEDDTALDQEKTDVLLSKMENSFKELEGKLSYTNRPPFNELAGQLRAFKDAKSQIDKSALNLYVARVLFFLSSEISVPKPDPVRLS